MVCCCDGMGPRVFKRRYIRRSEEESDQVVSDSEMAEEIAKMYEIDESPLHVKDHCSLNTPASCCLLVRYELAHHHN